MNTITNFILYMVKLSLRYILKNVLEWGCSSLVYPVLTVHNFLCSVSSTQNQETILKITFTHIAFRNIENRAMTISHCFWGQ